MECGFGWTEAKVPLGAGWEVRPGQVVESVSSGLRPVALGQYGQYLGKHSKIKLLVLGQDVLLKNPAVHKEDC